MPHGSASLTVSYQGGVAMTPGPPQLLVGEPSHTIKITGIRRKDRTYTVDFEYVPAAASSSDVRTAWRLQDVQGATSRRWHPNCIASSSQRPQRSRPTYINAARSA